MAKDVYIKIDSWQPAWPLTMVLTEEWLLRQMVHEGVPRKKLKPKRSSQVSVRWKGFDGLKTDQAKRLRGLS
jgi:hypothetical protein